MKEFHCRRSMSCRQNDVYPADGARRRTEEKNWRRSSSVTFRENKTWCFSKSSWNKLHRTFRPADLRWNLPFISFCGTVQTYLTDEYRTFWGLNLLCFSARWNKLPEYLMCSNCHSMLEILQSFVSVTFYLLAFCFCRLLNAILTFPSCFNVFFRCISASVKHCWSPSVWMVPYLLPTLVRKQRKDDLTLISSSVRKIKNRDKKRRNADLITPFSSPMFPFPRHWDRHREINHYDAFN